MNVSIVVPTYNAQNNLQKTKRLYKELVVKNYDLHIIDSSSTDSTIEDLGKLGINNITTIPSNQFDHGSTRNIAKNICKGEIIIFLTQDALLSNIDSIKNIVAVFEDEKIGAAYGRQIPYKNSSLFGKHLREFNYPKNTHIRTFEDRKTYGIKTAFMSNSFAAYRRQAMDKIGWFKDSLIVGEDTHAGAKLILTGYKIAYVATATVIHSHSYSIIAEFKRYFDIGAFHAMENWLLEEFGSPQGEGMRYIKSEFKYILSQRCYHLFFEFLLRNGMKYFGYLLGSKYFILPKFVIRKFSMHKKWWDKL